MLLVFPANESMCRYIMIKKAPKYDSFKPSSDVASRVKKKNKSTNTTAELALRRNLWKRGLRYRTYIKSLPGKPDIVFPRERVVVFCDGDFWHGRNWTKLKKQLACRKNADYWIPKIRYNMKRDSLQTKQLKDMGWYVLRFWETDMLKNPDSATKKIFEVVSNRRHGI